MKWYEELLVGMDFEILSGLLLLKSSSWAAPPEREKLFEQSLLCCLNTEVFRGIT